VAGPFTATAGQADFACNFAIQDDKDIAVTRKRGTVTAGLTLNVDYTVLAAGNIDGFTVRLNPVAAAGDIITVTGEAVIERLTSVALAGKFSATQVDRELDRSRIIDMELRRDVDHALPPGDLANTIYSYNSAGEPSALPVAQFLAGDFDAKGPLANRAAFNSQPAGFTFLDTDSRPLVFYMRQGAAGLWDGPFYYADIEPRLSFATKAAAQARNLSAVAVGTVIRLRGLTIEGLGSGHYVKLSGAPGAVKPWHFQSADGSWFELLKDAVLTPYMLGALGSGDDTAALSATFDFASGSPVQLAGGTFVCSSIVLTTDASIIGRGILTKKPGTTGHFINSSANLIIDGDITVDQNKVNCPNAGAGPVTDCAINHTGPKLFLNGVTIPDAVSVCVVSTATDTLNVKECTISGGWMCLSATLGVNAVAKVTRNRFKNATKDDNVQIKSARDVVIDGNTSSGAFRSGIVVASSVENVRIVNNYCFDNKIEVASGQGGWGIVCSTSSGRLIVEGNVLRNNERGPITIDTLNPSATDVWGSVANNICDGDYNGTRGTTGIGINGARYMNVSGNRIRRVSQGILAVQSSVLNISDNSIEDTTAFFVQVNTCLNVSVANNIMKGCSVTGAAVVQSVSTTGFSCIGNQISDLTGANVLGISLGDTSDFNISENSLTRSVSGFGYIFYFTGANVKGRIANNRFYSTTTAFQLYINGTGATLTNVVTERNDIAVPGIATSPNSYIFGAPSTIADGDIVNGVKDKFSVAPTGWTCRDGYMAVNNNIPQWWNGAAWVNI
jgi:hypothetical protein